MKFLSSQTTAQSFKVIYGQYRKMESLVLNVYKQRRLIHLYRDIWPILVLFCVDILR